MSPACYFDMKDLNHKYSDMTEELLEIESFVFSVARLHKASMPLSSSRYDFSVLTHMGFIAQENAWCDSWKDFFRESMIQMLARERDVRGLSSELDEFCNDKMISRLLRSLIVLGYIKPVLVHDDLWYGNCCTDNATDKPIVFDACVF